MSKANYKNTEIFESLPVPEAVRIMAVPAIISQLIVLIYNIADTFFVGRTNNPYMVAGASLILPVYNIALSLASLTGIGGGALISRLLGERNREEIRRVYTFTITLSLAVSLLFSVGTALFMKPLLNLLGAGPETYTYAKNYALCVIVIGGAPTVLANTFSNVIRSVGESKKAGFGITMGGLINITLDPLFMFVLFPKGMEIVGAGAATCVSNLISCGYFIWVLKGMGSDSVLKLCSPTLLPTKASISSIFTIGVPSSVAGFLFDLDYVVIDRLMSAYGDLPLAAIGIVLKAERLPLNIGIGICLGMVPIVAYNYSSGNRKRMDAVRRYSRKLGLICGFASVLMYLAFSGQIMRIFINDATTVALGANFLRIRALATPLMFLSFFHVYLFNGFGRGKEALFLGIMRWAAFNIPMLFLLNTLFGMYGIVFSQVTADVLTVSLSLYVYRNFQRKHLEAKC